MYVTTRTYNGHKDYYKGISFIEGYYRHTFTDDKREAKRYDYGDSLQSILGALILHNIKGDFGVEKADD